MKPHDVMHRLVQISRELVEARKFSNSNRCDDHLDQAGLLLGKLSDDIAIHLPDNEFEKYGACDVIDKA